MSDDEALSEEVSEPEPTEPPALPPEDESPFEIQPLDVVERGVDPPRTETRNVD